MYVLYYLTFEWVRHFISFYLNQQNLDILELEVKIWGEN